MRNVTNNYNIPLSLAVWLLQDDYDHSAVADPDTYSVTEILKPIRKIILGRRANLLPANQQMSTDIIGLFNARVGQSVHAAIEKAWESAALPDCLAELGIPISVGQTIQINPKQHDPNKFNLYMEQRRTIPVFDTFKLTGQYDFNFNGQLEDFKFTKTYALTMGVNDEYYTQQGSLYKYIFPDQITSDTTRISFLFGDWMASRTGQSGYPTVAIDSKEYPLMSRFKTDIFIKEKFKDILKYRDLPESQLPECNREELWMEDDVIKYFKDPNGKRATKVCVDITEANEILAKNKGVGAIKIIQGKVKACAYCSAFQLCKQKDQYLLSGQLVI